MSWAQSVLGVWQWGAAGVTEVVERQLRPACRGCSLPPSDAAVSAVGVNTAELAGTDGIREMTGAGNGLTRLAGLCGAAAIGLGAYGAHALAARPATTEEQKKAFEVANR